MSFNIESFYRASIVQNILDTDTCPFNCNVSKLPVLTSGLLTISPNTDNEEIVEYTHAGTPWAAGVISIVKRGVKPSTVVAYASWVSGTDYQVTANLKSHTLNDSIRWDINHIHINQAQNETGVAKVSKSGDTMTGKLQFSGTTHAGIKLNSLTTTQRDALTPAVGDKIINTTTGTEQTYIGGTWLDAGTSTVANASITVSGKLEIGTQTQINDIIDTGETGALLAVIPSTLDAKVMKQTSLINWGITGEVKMWTTATPPTNWLICNWTSLLRAGTYAELFSVIGTTYGTADGTHFNIPDFRGRSPIGAGTGTATGATAHTLGATPISGSCGEETHLLLAAESGVPAHTHSYTVGNGIWWGWNNGWAPALNTSWYTTGANATANAASAHNIMSPSTAVNFIIRI